MTTGERLTDIVERLARIEQKLESINGKTIARLKTAVAVIYAVPPIAGAVWAILWALGRL